MRDKLQNCTTKMPALNLLRPPQPSPQAMNRAAKWRGKQNVLINTFKRKRALKIKASGGDSAADREENFNRKRNDFLVQK